MLDIKWIINNKGAFVESLNKRNVPLSTFDYNTIVALYENKKSLLLNKETLEAERNKISDSIAKEIKNLTPEGLNNLKAQVKSINEELKISTSEFNIVDEKLHNILSNIPNILQESVPYGKSEEDNQIISIHGTKPAFDFIVQDHHSLSVKRDLMDFKRASNIAGSRFVIMKGKLSKLDRALRDFMLDICINEFGYTEHSLPYFMNSKTAYGCGQLPKMSEDMFHITKENLYLIPTSETALVGIYQDEIINHNNLPTRMCSWSPCFRSEAGAAGKDTSGIIRQHQFSKVEIVSIIQEELAEQEHQRMLSCAQYILNELNLHYRTILLCGGDTGFCSSKTYDIEVWIPTQNKYREIASCSNTTTFQSRRSNIRYKEQNGDNKHPFMLNSSALPIGRTIVAILENFQNKDGFINIPAKLQKYYLDEIL